MNIDKVYIIGKGPKRAINLDKVSEASFFL